MKKSSSKIISIIIPIVIFLAVLFVLLISAVFKNNNAAPKLFGYNIYIMSGTNMEPAIPDNAVVFSKVGPLSDEPVGSVALCIIDDNDLTTVLRVSGVEQSETGETVYLMKSDKSPSSKYIKVSSDKVIGRAVSISKPIGYVLSFITSQTGILILVVLPCAILLIIQLISVLKKISDKDDESEPSERITDDEDYREDDFDSFYGGAEPNTYTEEIEMPPVAIEKKPVETVNKFNAKTIKTEASAFEKSQHPSVLAKESSSPKAVISENEKPIERTVQQSYSENRNEKIEAPAVELDKNGKAEYVKMKPTADLKALDKVLPPVESHSAKATHSIDNLKTALESSKNKSVDVSQVLFDARTRKPSQPTQQAEIQPISQPIVEPTPAPLPQEQSPFISPRTKKTHTNKTLEDLMKLLDQKDDKK